MKFFILIRSILFIVLMYYASAGYSSTSVIVLGDSLSAGYKLQKNESWVELLSAKVQAENLDINIINASVSGATTAEGLSSLQKLLDKYKPNILILALGSNDGLRGIPALQIQNNLEKIIVKSQAQQVKVLLIGFKLPLNYGKTYTQAFADIFPRLSKKYKIPLVPFLLAGFETNLSDFQSDQLHPTAAVQAKILENVWTYLSPMLVRKT